MISVFSITSKALRLLSYSSNKFCSSTLPKINAFKSDLNGNDHDFDVKEFHSNDTPIETLNYAEKKETPYYIESGLRKVYPYKFLHSTNCKGRWTNRTLVDVYGKEFALFPREELERRILTGLMKVNGEAVDLSYKLKNSDIVSSSVHRHELPVLASSIKVVFEDENFLVVDKPPSIPIHPCGLYRFNSIIFLLDLERNRRDLHTIHRLDRLTSGVLIFAKNLKKAQEMHEDMSMRNVQKEYVCRVEGEFPDDVIVCNKPLKNVRNKVGITLVNPEGKIAITEFKKLSFNGKSSVVKCKPYTGRTHQIRVHLQYLGYPILNDPLYNSYVFGPEKGKQGRLYKGIGQLLEDLIKEHSTEWWLNKPDEKAPVNLDTDLNLANLVFNMKCYSMDKQLLSNLYKKDPSRFSFDKHCYFCSYVFQEPKPSNLFMFLHACKYKSDKWEFQTEIPLWASDNWDVM